MRDALYPLWKRKEKVLERGLQETGDFNESRCQDCLWGDHSRMSALSLEARLWAKPHEDVRHFQKNATSTVCFTDVETLTGASPDLPPSVYGDPESQGLSNEPTADGEALTTVGGSSKSSSPLPCSSLAQILWKIGNLTSQPCWKEFCRSCDNRYNIEPIL